ncbi:12322_t:CDS:2, partial [Funneliformis geosporum]
DTNQVEYLPPVDVTGMLERVRAAIYLSLDELWSVPFDNALIVTFLDPRFKHFNWASNGERDKAYHLVKTLYGENGAIKKLKENDIINWEKAFKMTFQDPGSYVGYLHEEIQFGIKNANAYYNYIALIQSSGYGKSRAVRELSKLNYWILLFCFRSNESSGFPLKTPKSNDFLKELHECENADDVEKLALLWISVSMQ